MSTSVEKQMQKVADTKRSKDEEEDVYLLRLLQNVANLPDAEFQKLPEAGQAWFIVSANAVNDGKPPYPLSITENTKWVEATVAADKAGEPAPDPNDPQFASASEAAPEPAPEEPSTTKSKEKPVKKSKKASTTTAAKKATTPATKTKKASNTVVRKTRSVLLPVVASMVSKNKEVTLEKVMAELAKNGHKYAQNNVRFMLRLARQMHTELAK